MQENLTLEQQKKELQMTLSKFTHEIRNPVALIQSELQMLASAHPELNSYDGWYGIMENLEYIRELLNELSRYNNAEHLSPVQTDITLLLKSIIRSFRPALDYLGITLETDIPQTLPLLCLDQTKIHQALLNLLRNAQDGCGMTDSQIKNVFNPFVTYKPTGTGLGLPVTRQIIEAHGGSLKVRSVPGKGTEFQIFFRL